MTPLTPLSLEPSTTELLRRAARLGPPRPSLESIVLADDSILGRKREPTVAARRERFTRIVKGAVAACIGLCALATVVTLATGTASASTSRVRAAKVASDQSNARLDLARTKTPRSTIKTTTKARRGR